MTTGQVGVAASRPPADVAGAFALLAAASDPKGAVASYSAISARGVLQPPETGKTRLSESQRGEKAA